MLNKNKRAGFAKKIIIIIIAVAILAIISFVGKQKGYFPSSEDLSQEEILAKQMEELESLKQENSANPLTQEEVNKQSKDLEALRQKDPTLTQDQINKQAEELDALKVNNQ